MKLADFFVKIGVDADTLKVKDFGRAVGEIPLQVAGAVTALAGIQFGIAHLAGEFMNTAVGFELFTNQTGLSAQELQRWQIVAQQANVSAEAMTSSVAGLQKQLSEIALGRGNLQPFLMMGISPKDNAFGVLKQLRSKVPGMDPAMASNMIAQMGLSPEMINVLTLSEQKFEQFGRKVRGMTKEDEKAFLDAKLALTQLGLEFKDFSSEHLAPFMRAFVDLSDVVRNFKDFLPLLVVAVGALGLAFAPLTVILVTLIGVLDDILAFREGRNSLLGLAVGPLKPFVSPAGATSGEKAVAFGTALAELILDRLGVPKGMTLPGGMADFSERKAQEVKVDIRIDGSGEPRETAVAVEEHLKRTLDRAGTQTSGKLDRR